MKSPLPFITFLGLLTIFSLAAADSPSAPGPGASRHVILLGVDGLRADSCVAAHTPHLDDVMQRGAYSLAAVSSKGQPTVSGPSWSSLLTGVWSSQHGVTNNDFTGHRFTDYPNFLVRIEAHRPGAFTASIVNWAPINQHILTRVDYEKRGLKDVEVTEEAVRCIREHGPHALFLQYDELDGAGHKAGYHPANAAYLETVAMIDRQVGTILAAVTDRKAAHPTEEWLLIIVSDHGGTAAGKHGGQSPEEIIVPWLLMGDGVLPGKIEATVYNVDAPVTALAWLGIPIDPAWNLAGQPRALPTRP